MMRLRSWAMRLIVVGLVALRPLAVAGHLRAQADTLVSMRNDSVSIRLVDVELRAAIQALGRYLDRPVIVGNVNNVRVTLETPRPIPRAEVPRMLRGLLESQNINLVSDSTTGVYRLEPRETQRPQTPFQQPGMAGAAQTLELFVIRLKHAKAADVAATVNALYGRASALGEIGARPPTLSRDLQMQQVPPGLPVGVPPAPGAPPGAGAGGVTGRTAILTGDVTIVPDARANSLLIRASRADFTLLEAAVQQLDIRPLQVLIEVLIAELRKDRNIQFGVGASLAATKVKGTDNMTVSAATTGSGVSDFVLKVMGIGGVDVEATLRAAASRGDATIVSRPVLLAANNEPAEINVGSQRPFVQVARVLPTDNTARDQVVQYKDVGTRLRVVPTISEDDYVMLQVTQEVNAATAEQAFDAPIISTRSVDTKLLVRNGQTIVLGGLTDRQRDNNQGGVPLLSSIPWLGGLFGHVERKTTETELFLFLTPRIIRVDADVDSLTDPLRRRARRIERD
jgi:general secretion pathway protein D